jgi:hypothetical protein
MKKTIVIIVVLVLITLTLLAGLAYLNNLFLPKRVQGLIIKSIEEATGKKVSLASLKINIFKGVVLEDLIIYDKEDTLISIKEVSCIF